MKFKILLVLFFLINGCAMNNTPQSFGNKSVETILNSIKVGFDKDTAIDKLTQQKIENGYDSEQKAIFSIVRDVGDVGVVRESIQIIFYLDENNKIIKIVTKKVFTGP